ncbi:chemotaxis protein CheX [Geobacter sp. DSM 9736]|uniref:chemotaxis protein CheX n=1 Tax=Geobacter sp. DSM 9736 TaxID=1277350 RepID=UPI000B506060|nr:chemotaxis protein CheX [Geobacter sp. DSM 9736]SNB45576.1 Chemotaxis protein CheX, a CheY~P-specific phosphatase [Geobacter sp. DSM 9736]
MAVKFFGQFLVEKRIVSRESLLEAIRLQESVNLSFGDLAIAMGYMSQQDVVRVNQAQRSQDERFGDLAVKLGVLTEDRLQQVLVQQKSTHLYIGEALVRVGALSEADLPRHLEDFKEDQAPYMTERVKIPSGTPHPEMCEIIADLTYKMLTRVARLTFRPEQCLLSPNPAPNDIGAVITFSGDIQARYLFTISRFAQKKLAAAMLNQADVGEEPQEILDDTVMEFINVVCGNIAARAAQFGKRMEINPPEIVAAPEMVKIEPGETGLSFPVCYTDGEHSELYITIR